MQTYHTVPLPPGPLGLTFSNAHASPFKLRILSIAESSPLVGKVQPFDIVDQYVGVGISHSFVGVANANLLKGLLSADEKQDSRVLVLRREDELIPLVLQDTALRSKDGVHFGASKHGIKLSSSRLRDRILQVESVDEKSHLFGRVNPGDYISSAICVDGHETADIKVISDSLVVSSSYCQAIRLVRARWIPVPAVGEEDLGVSIAGSPPIIYCTTNKDGFGLRQGQEVLSMKLPSGKIVHAPSTDLIPIYFGDKPRPALTGYSILVSDAAAGTAGNQAGAHAQPIKKRQEKYFGANTATLVFCCGLPLLFACCCPCDERPAVAPSSQKSTVVRI